MKIRKCERCSAEATHWKRCDVCYRCDDCWSRDNLCSYVEGVLCDPCHDQRVEQRIEAFDGETEYTPEVVCPHCGYVSSDSWEMTEGDRVCADCENRFVMTRHQEVTYSTEKELSE